MSGRVTVLVLALFSASCGDVSFCTDSNPDQLPNCEICNNNIDDDLDGKIDCDDSLCEDSAFCRDAGDDAVARSTAAAAPSAATAGTLVPGRRDRSRREHMP